MDWKAFKRQMNLNSKRPAPEPLQPGSWLMKIQALVEPCLIGLERIKPPDGPSTLHLRVWYRERDLTFDVAKLLEVADRDEEELANLLGGARGVLMWGQEPDPRPYSPWPYPNYAQAWQSVQQLPSQTTAVPNQIGGALTALGSGLAGITKLVP